MSIIKNIKDKFKYRKASIIDKMFLSVIITTAIIELSAVGANFIDGIVTAKMLGADAMASTGIAIPYYSIIGVISGALAVGMQSLCSSELAKGNTKRMQGLFSMLLIVGAIASVIFALLFFFASDTCAYLLGARGNAANLLTGTSDYLKGLAIGSIPNVLIVVLSSAIQLDSGGKLVRIGALTGTISDIVLDFLAVKAGLGLFGIGLASSVSYFLNFFVLLIHFTKKDRMVRFTFKDLPFNKLGKVCLLGSEKATRRLTNTIRPILLNTFIISAGGSLGMAALSIRNNFGNFLEIPITGIAGATALLTAVAYGERCKEDIERIAHLAHVYTFIYCIFIAAVLFIAADPIAKFYVAEPGELQDMVKFSVYCLAIGSIFLTLIVNRTSYLQSTRQIIKSQYLTFGSKLVVVVLSAFVCVNLWGSYGVIASFVVSDAIICLCSFIYYQIKTKKIFPSSSDLISLPPEFDIKPQDVIELSISTMEEAVVASEQTQLFCKGHKLDPKLGYKAALCLEEITSNIITYGFGRTKNLKIKSIDIRILISDGHLVMRIRDCCPKFDLSEKIKLVYASDTGERYMGIKMINKICTDIKYVSTLNTNTLIITV